MCLGGGFQNFCFLTHVRPSPSLKTCPLIKTRKRLPQVLTKKEVELIISKITNVKHTLIISILYGSGLRVSEVVNIRVGNRSIQKHLGHASVKTTMIYLHIADCTVKKIESPL
ncbi:MAG TPA: hypothetical protein DDY71_01595 [Spirochaetia bacterium]|nr:hypothetical protein [Spirochaetia bacterium]HBI36313.1 hypothetical protein [Spirochaetia bacterium]